MRTTSNYPNRRHTPDSMRDELMAAQRMGKEQEIADLSLLIQNAERPKGRPALPGVQAARNRQGMRRFNREKIPGRAYINPVRALQIGDWVEDPSGARWRVSRIHGDVVWYDEPGQPTVNCPVKLLRMVEPPASAPRAPTAPRVQETPVAVLTACEALYQGVWDAYEVQDWTALERALRAYEVKLSELGV
jgi:hypothetical protein